MDEDDDLIVIFENITVNKPIVKQESISQKIHQKVKQNKKKIDKKLDDASSIQLKRLNKEKEKTLSFYRKDRKEHLHNRLKGLKHEKRKISEKPSKKNEKKKEKDARQRIIPKSYRRFRNEDRMSESDESSDSGVLLIDEIIIESLKKNKEKNDRKDYNDKSHRSIVKKKDDHHHDIHHKSNRDKKNNDKSRSTRSKSRSKDSIDDHMMIDNRPNFARQDKPCAFDTDSIQKMALFCSEIPEEPQLSLPTLLGSHQGLTLKPVSTCALSTVVRPLGCAYDRKLRMFIYTDTQRGNIEMATYDGYRKGKANGFYIPSAISVISHGSHFAVLDYNGITLIDILSNTRKQITNSFHGSYRGLCTTSDANLCTIRYKIPMAIVVYSSSSLNQQLCSFDYTRIMGLPSFICSNNEMIYVTDLEVNQLSCYSYSSSIKKLSIVATRNLANDERSTSDIRTKYMSGIVADSNHNLIVADARSHTLHWITSHGSLISNISFPPNEAPYMSGISVTPSGRIMICCRRSDQVKMYDIVPIVSNEYKLTQSMANLKHV